MHLKSFSTYGFKSFADKTELTFDKGITAVVGPNGSGKSNISDAIRWVLGEQSAKYLRGSKMEDVIFSGSSKRKALGVAEVNLEFDNSDHALPLDFDTVSLTRRLYRSGDSDYAINKKNCRLKDIIDLMADTGLGKGSMSIIGQNKIDEILNSRPEDRRMIFEEAAGIAKYRLRKKDAVRRLEDTAGNLTRIHDIKTEVENQVEPLAAAAAKTEKYNGLSARLRDCRLAVLLQKLEAQEEANRALAEKKQFLEQEYVEAAAKLSTNEAEQAKLQLELDALAERYSKLQEDIKDKETALEKLRGSQNVLDERAAQSQRAAERLTERNEKLGAQADELEQKMQELAAEFDALDKARLAASLQVEKLSRERDEQAEALAAANTQSVSAQSEFFTEMQQLLSLRNELRSLEQEQEQRARRREALKRSIDEAEEQLAKLEEQYRRLLEEQGRCETSGQVLAKEAMTLQEQGARLEGELRKLQAGQQTCQRELTAAETREQQLRKLQSAYEGFGYGSKSVLKAPESLPWRRELIGVATELLHVEPKYVTAIETALGEGAQNLVIRSSAAAKAAIAYLKQSGGGRATFLPLDTVQRRMPTAEEARLAKLEGICGFATDLLTCEAEAESAISFLLGRVLIAENIDAALAAARAGRFRIRVVTLDGDVVNAGGSLTGGSRKHKEGYLSRALEIDKAAEAVRKLHGEMLSWQEQVEEQEEALVSLAKKQRETNEALQQQRLKYSEQKLRLEQLQESKTGANENLMLLLDDRSAITSEYMANRDKVKELREAVQEREAKDTKAKELLEGLKRQIAMQTSALTAVENQLQDAKIQLETSAAKTSYMSERMKGLDADTLRVRDEIKSNKAEQERLAAVVENCGQEKIRLAEQSTALLADLQHILGGKDRYGEERGALQQRQEQLEQSAKQWRSATSASESRLRATELELARQSSDYEHALAELAEDYQLDEAAAKEIDLGELRQQEPKALHKQESKLAAEISALGPINMAAIEEYAAVKERYEFLQKQYTDLATAKENLEAVITEINSGMTKRFKVAFGKINEYFAQCYVKLFGGGTALLKLTDPEDLLNSGIDIEVQPPGKKLQSLFLMSGGERALTVIALLFALLSYQPSPFCILDEIDAPLDDANIERFSNFLRNYSTDTQFIIITHRKGTMEAADIMYGVTMEESGVSKLLSVKIHEKEQE